MNTVEKLCQDILSDTIQDKTLIPTITKVASPTLPEGLPAMMKKVASEIREVAKPVEVTNEDLSHFIGRLYGN